MLRGNGNLSSLRGDPAFEALAAEQWDESVRYYGDRCASEGTGQWCARWAVALQMTDRDAEAQQAAIHAASLEETEDGCRDLAWYYALTRNREEVLRFLRRAFEIRAAPDPLWRPQAQRDFAWLVGDPEFDAFVAEVTGRGPGSAPQVSK